MLLNKNALLALVISFLNGSVFSQVNTASVSESVVFATDRTTYIAGETILLKANCIVSDQSSSDKSSIEKIEFYDDAFQPIFQKDARIKNKMLTGSLATPCNLADQRILFKANVAKTNKVISNNTLTITLYDRSFKVISQKSFPISNELCMGNIEIPYNITGDTVFFKASTAISAPAFPAISNVLYVELYDQNLKIISKNKIQIQNGTAVGNMEIPTDIITGNYFIRAYTQYMRNFDEELFYTNQLTIINPDLPAKETIQTVKTDFMRLPDNKTIALQSDKEFYSTRSLVTLTMKGEKNTNINISIVKKGSYQPNYDHVNDYFKTNDTTEKSSKPLEWMPETRAVSISGKVIDQKNNSPIPNSLVYVTTMDSTRQFHVTRTKADGTFIFSLTNLHGNRIVYVAPSKSEGKEASIVINNDFSPLFGNADYVPEKIDSVRKSLFNQLYLNKQIGDHYTHPENLLNSYMRPISNPFEEKSEATYLKDYIALENMTQVLTEIASYTTIKNNKGIPSIQAFDKKNHNVYPSTIVLLDNIPFHDHAKLLNIPPSKIVSVKTVSEPFVCGNEILYGIVLIQSKGGDLAGLGLPKDVAAVDYTTFDPSVTISYDDYIQAVNADKRTPDFRNTLYWNPNMVLTGDNQSLQFYTSDCAGEYDIIVRGLNDKGEYIYSSKTISISNLSK